MADNGRIAIEPVLMLGVSLLRYLEALVDAGLVARQSRQRLDSTQMFGVSAG